MFLLGPVEPKGPLHTNIKLDKKVDIFVSTDLGHLNSCSGALHQKHMLSCFLLVRSVELMALTSGNIMS